MDTLTRPDALSAILEAARKYIKHREGDGAASPDFALAGFDPKKEGVRPNGTASIERAEAREGAVAVTFKDSDGEIRSPRLYDTDAFMLMRLLVSCGSAFRTNKTYKPIEGSELGHFYLTIDIPGLPNLSMLRLIAGSPSGKTTRQISKRQPEYDLDLDGTHKDCRRSNLTFKPTIPNHDGLYPEQHTSRVREAAIEAAVAAFDSPSKPAYRDLLERAFTLVDKSPLGSKRSSRPLTTTKSTKGEDDHDRTY